MRENKIAIIWSFAITALSLLLTIVAHCNCYEYISNIFAGIFASGLLTLMIAIINYRIARRRTLECFYSYALKAANNYNLFENDNDLERAIDSVLLMNQFDYLGLDTAYGELCFFCHDAQKRKYIFDKIYSPTVELRRLISEKSFHFMKYRKVSNGNKAVMKEFIEEIDAAIMERATITQSNDPIAQITTTRNKIVKQLHTELYGKYYELMYKKVTRKHMTIQNSSGLKSKFR